MPEKPATKDGITSYIWHIPSVKSNALKQLEYRVSADNTFTYLKFAHVTVDDIKYGPKASLKLNPPAWPDCPIENNDKFDFAVMMKLMSSAMSIFKK